MQKRGVDLGTGVRLERVSAQQRVEIGRYLVDVKRTALGREIRTALGRAG